MTQRPRHSRSAFSLIELMIVIMIMVGLSLIAIPAYGYLKNKSGIDRTQGVLHQIALAMESYGLDHWSTSANAVPSTATMWDLNGDGDLDGDPSDNASEAPLVGGYSGFMKMTGCGVPQTLVRNGDLIYDTWGTRVKVAVRTTLPPGERFGVWSYGPDRTAGTADDLWSWK